jgi:UDP-N-acetylglucosamine 3-dehydrogenase
MRGKARIVQIGVGGWGHNHARVLSEMGVLHAIVDTDDKRMSEVKNKHDIPWGYRDIDSMLEMEVNKKNDERPNLDGAVVTTPSKTHFTIAKKLLEAGLHVFIEKPMTYSIEEGEELVKIAKEKNLTLTCGYIERFNPVVKYVKNLVDTHQYGKLVLLEFHRENRMPMHISDVGIIYDTSVHDIDTANWLFGAAPKAVYCKAGSLRHEHEDYACIMLDYGMNRTASIISNWVTPKKLRTFNAVFTDALISSNFYTQEIEVCNENERIIPNTVKSEPLSDELKIFIGSVEGTNEPLVKPSQAVLVTKIAEAALESAKKRMPVFIADEWKND